MPRHLAFRRRERIDPDQELRALGVTNIVAACAGAMPVAGGFARSMVNFDAGARTQVAAIITACWVALAALLFTGLLTDLPKAVLAAIIVVGVWQLVDFAGLRHTWRYDRGDGAAQGATLIGVLVFGIELGLLIGVPDGAGTVSVPHQPPISPWWGGLPAPNISATSTAMWSRPGPACCWYRVDENLYFANVPKVESELQNLVVDREGLHDLVLIFSGVAYMNASALEMLENFELGLATAGIRLHLAEVKGPVLDRLRNSEL